ncbi:MAG: 2-nitropropane dioxygenase [Actinomycetia bacterium]|nr:2-nitropropane dioxygenase [Actinomycetes bacterium]
MFDHPQIVLAPLAGGPSTPELTAAVSNAGGLGFLAAGYLTPQGLAEQLRRTRELTTEQIGVNVFVLDEVDIDDAAVAAYARELEPEAQARNVQLGKPRFDDDWLAEKLDVIVRADVAVVSTTFGCLPAETVARLQESGTRVWATVTAAHEARAARDAGVDSLVVQGAEAGGHRGAWRDDGEATPLLELLASIDVGLPLVATGGIADRDGVAAALTAGAQAAQLGTAFLLCPEAGTSEPHRRALRTGGDTSFTRSFTGRSARGIVNRFMVEHADAPAAYPHIHHLTAPLRAAARAAGDAEGINLWAGVNFARAEELPAAEVVARLGT